MILVSIAVLVRTIHPQPQVWVMPRQEQGPLNGLWEFPGGKIEAMESPLEACLREVKEEVGIQLQPQKLHLMNIYRHDYTDRQVCLYPFYTEINDLEPQGGKWIDLNDELVASQDIPAANNLIIRDLLVYLKQQEAL